jgi:hypothetical protein
MTIEDYRRFYAEELRYIANLDSPLVEAFAHVPGVHASDLVRLLVKRLLSYHRLPGTSDALGGQPGGRRIWRA